MILFVVLTTCLPSTTLAQLEWDTTVVRREQSMDDLRVEARFTCRNTGDYPLYVRRISRRSGPLQGRLQGGGRAIRPGESREVVLRGPNRLLFTETEFVVEVQTDERGVGPQPLRLQLLPQGWEAMGPAERDALEAEEEAIRSMPLPVTLDRPGVVWFSSDAEASAEVQSIEVRFTNGHGAAVLGLDLVEGDADAFDARVQVVEEDRHYRIDVSPAGVGAEEDPALRAENRLWLAVWRLRTTLNEYELRRAATDTPLFVRALVMPGRPGLVENNALGGAGLKLLE